jgi:hypothetical protein
MSSEWLQTTIGDRLTIRFNYSVALTSQNVICTRSGVGTAHCELRAG